MLCYSGKSNAKNLIIGNDKLPQGTYYYVLKFLNEKNELRTGFVILAY